MGYQSASTVPAPKLSWRCNRYCESSLKLSSHKKGRIHKILKGIIKSILHFFFVFYCTNTTPFSQSSVLYCCLTWSSSFRYPHAIPPRLERGKEKEPRARSKVWEFSSIVHLSLSCTFLKPGTSAYNFFIIFLTIIIIIMVKQLLFTLQWVKKIWRNR